MNTRELLYLAAKASGIKLIFDKQGMPRNCTGLSPENNMLAAAIWAPIADDGDCARLEAALGLDVVWFFSSVCIKQIFFHISISTQYSDHNGDKQAARRMASVRAAAEIGREMK